MTGFRLSTLYRKAYTLQPIRSRIKSSESDCFNNESTIVKESLGFKVKLHLWGHIKKNDAMQKLKKIVEEFPEENNVKIITCALMGHGLNMRQENAEGDW